MRYCISEWKGQKVGGFFVPLALQCIPVQMLFSWLTPLFVDQGGRGLIAGMQYPALKGKKKSKKHKAVCKHWELLKQ